ncbi:MAG: response regulator, partial [Lachnospiraceae bacterium]|nr:response regulator [Lachnospiraceae bacterium]
KLSQSPAGYYQAILMDLRMPVMTGFEAAAAIRALEHADAKSIPIIAMSADAFDDDVQKCKECGMNDHTSKPINVDSVVHLLRKYIKI